MIKEFLIKKMLKGKGVPDEQVEMFLTVIKKNPALFQQIAGEVEAEITKPGVDQTQATMAVMQRHQAELREIFPK